MKTTILLLLLILTLGAAPPVPATGARESEWTDYVSGVWAGKSVRVETEYRLADQSRVDIYSTVRRFGWDEDSAWEVDRAAKWKEAIGQAAFYQEMTGSASAGVVLLCLGGKHDELNKIRCAIACHRCQLGLVIVTADGTISQYPTNTLYSLRERLLKEKRR